MTDFKFKIKVINNEVGAYMTYAVYASTEEEAKRILSEGIDFNFTLVEIKQVKIPMLEFVSRDDSSYIQDFPSMERADKNYLNSDYLYSYCLIENADKVLQYLNEKGIKAVLCEGKYESYCVKIDKGYYWDSTTEHYRNDVCGTLCCIKHWGSKRKFHQACEYAKGGLV